MLLTVARIGRAHGLNGEVSVELRTDIPEDRLAPGKVLSTDPVTAGPLTIARSRIQGGRWFLHFSEVTTREGAEALGGVLLVVESEGSNEDDAWYVHELAGLRAERPNGDLVGEVVDLEHLPSQDLLVIKEPNGNRARIPFVAAIVPVVDVAGGRIVIDPPYGLLSDETTDDETTDGEEVPDAD